MCAALGCILFLFSSCNSITLLYPGVDCTLYKNMSTITSTILSMIRIVFIISFPISTNPANPAGCAVFLGNLYTAIWEGNDTHECWV